MKVLFLGFSLPEDEFMSVLATDSGMPIQTHRFGWMILRALRAADVDVTTVSTAPILDFPANSKIVFRGSRFREHQITGVTVPFVNLLGLKHLTRHFFFTRAGSRDAANREPNAVMVHGLNSALLWSAIRVGARFSTPVVVIMTDPPVLRNSRDGWVSWQLKRVDGRLIRRALGRINAAIVLTERLATDFAPGTPHLLMEGIADGEWTRAPQESKWTRTESEVVYAGGVSNEYGVGDLLEAVRLAGPKWKLKIYGRGPAEDAVRSASRESDRVELLGLVGMGELSAAYATADVLVNPRPDSARFTPYSFPSKILEYMASGTLVVSTRLPGIPAEYEPYIVWSEDGAEGLSEAISRALSMSPGDRAEFGSRAQTFAMQFKSPAAQGRRIRQFLESLTDELPSPRTER